MIHFIDLTNNQFNQHFKENNNNSVADPGFPVGGRGPRRGGAWTPEPGTFRKFCMSKQKNLDP